MNNVPEPKPVSASGNPCQECPFRKSNAGREHPHGVYSNEQFTTEWKRVTEGDFFACHVTAPDLHPYDERSKTAGYVTPVETGQRPECAGSALAIQREIALAAEYPDYDAYKAARPTGLSRRAFVKAIQRVNGTATPALRAPSKFPLDAIRDPSTEIDATSPVWSLGGEVTDALVARIDELLGCSCPVCVRHAEVHPVRTIVTSDGGSATVDETLADLLEVMNRSGIRTTDSCQNLLQAVTQLWPERLRALSREQAGTVTYAKTIRTGNAFIRMHATSPAEKRFLEATVGIQAVTAQRSGDIAQVDFPLSELPRLTELVSDADQEGTL